MKCIQKLHQADNIYQSLKPIILLTYFSGIDPLRPNCTKLNGFNDTLCGLIMYFIHTICYITFYIVAYQQGETIIGYFFKSTVTRFGDNVQRLTGLLGTATIFIIAIIKRHTLSQVLQMLSKIDLDLLKLNHPINYHKTLRFSYIVMISMIIFTACYLAVSYTLLRIAGVHPTYSVFMTFSMPLIHISVVVVKFVCLCAIIRFRFTKINQIFNSNLDRRDSFNQYYALNNSSADMKHISYVKSSNQTDLEINYSTNITKTSITQISQTHNLLCDICEILDNYFSYIMLVTVAISFIYIIFDGYYILEVLLNSSSSSSATAAAAAASTKHQAQFQISELTVFLASQLILYLVLLAAIVESTYRLFYESQRCSINVRKLMNLCESPSLKEELGYLALQIENRLVKFTAAGLFNLDRSLLFTVSGATTTYLIILIQFSSNPLTLEELIKVAHNYTQHNN